MACSRSDQRAISQMHPPEIAVMPGRLIGDCNTQSLEAIEVVEIEASIRPLAYIGRRIGCMPRIVRIVPAGIDDALEAPMRKIFHRSRPADIVADTVALPSRCIMAPKDIDPVSEYMRLAVRCIFPARQIGVHDLASAHSVFPLMLQERTMRQGHPGSRARP